MSEAPQGYGIHKMGKKSSAARPDSKQTKSQLDLTDAPDDLLGQLSKAALVPYTIELRQHIADLEQQLAEREATIARYENGLAMIADGSTPWLDLVGWPSEPWELLAKYAQQLIEPPTQEAGK